MTDVFGTIVKSADGRALMKSKNLRALLRYAGVSPVVKVQAAPCQRNTENGKLYVEYADGATCRAHFASHVVLLEWLGARRWDGAVWDVDQPALAHLTQRAIHALEKLNRQGRY